MRRTTLAVAILSSAFLVTTNNIAPAASNQDAGRAEKAKQAEKAKECEYLKERIASTRSLIASQEKQKMQAEAQLRECEDGRKTKNGKHASCEGVSAVPKGIQETIEQNKKRLKEAEASNKRLCS